MKTVDLKDEATLAQVLSQNQDEDVVVVREKSRTQRHEIFQIGTVPVFLDNDGAAENIGGRRSKPQ